MEPTFLFCVKFCFVYVCLIPFIPTGDCEGTISRIEGCHYKYKFFIGGGTPGFEKSGNPYLYNQIYIFKTESLCKKQVIYLKVLNKKVDRF